MDRGESWRAVSLCDPSPKKLILAAADCAEGVTDENGVPVQPPPELILAWRIERWGAGAVFDGPIPAKLLARMGAVQNVYNAFMSYKAGSGNFAKWAELNPQHFAIVAEIREMRKQRA